MDSELLKEIDRFWEEADKEDSCELGYIAISLVPKLLQKIFELQNKDELWRNYERSI